VADEVIDLDARRVHRQPSTRHRLRRQLLRQASAAHEATDAVVDAARRASTIELLHAQREQVAAEAAALRFERDRGVADAGRLISRRIRALRAVADATIQIHTLEPGKPSPSATRRVLDLLLADVLAAAHEIFDHTTAEQLADALQKRLERGAVDQLIRR
jgi:hypothetical protein